MPIRTFFSYDPGELWLLPPRSLFYSKAQRNFSILLRRMRQMHGEWVLICTTHNVLKLWWFGEGMCSSICMQWTTVLLSG